MESQPVVANFREKCRNQVQKRRSAHNVDCFPLVEKEDEKVPLSLIHKVQTGGWGHPRRILYKFMKQK